MKGEFLIFERSGAVKVDLVRFLLSPEGKRQLDAMKKISDFARRNGNQLPALPQRRGHREGCRFRLNLPTRLW